MDVSKVDKIFSSRKDFFNFYWIQTSLLLGFEYVLGILFVDL